MKEISRKLLVILLVLLGGGSLSLAYAQPLTADEGLINMPVSEEIPLEYLIDESELISEEIELLPEEEPIAEEEEPLVNELLDVLSELDGGVIPQSENVIDVVSTASRTATITDWYSLEPGTLITNATTEIKGNIEMATVYQQIFSQTRWNPSTTNKDIISDKFKNPVLVMSLDDGTKIIEREVILSSSNAYSFEFTDLDLTDTSEIRFSLAEINFDGPRKPSKLTFSDMVESIEKDSIEPPKLGFGYVGDFEFESQTFSYAISENTIKQKAEFCLEIIGAPNSNWSLLASHSGNMIAGSDSIDAQIYYNGKPLTEGPNEIINCVSEEDNMNSSTTLIFGQGNNFTLRLLDPYQIKGDTTYTTTINWTLQNVSVE